MESNDSEDDRTVVCPICERKCKSVAGLRQRVTKSHLKAEIDEAIASKTASSTQHSQEPPTFNKFQIVSGTNETRSYQQFDIIETEVSSLQY